MTEILRNTDRRYIRADKMLIGDDRSMLREESRSSLPRTNDLSRARRGYNAKPVELLFFYDVIIVEACALR